MTPNAAVLVVSGPFAVMAFCLAFGAFAATMAVRMARGEQWFTGRSRCDGCGIPLRAWETLPLIGWAARGGKCGCRARTIDPIHPWGEAIAALVGLAALLSTPATAGWTALFGCLLLACALVDLRTFVIPDILCVSLLAAGVCWRLWRRQPLLDAIIAAGIAAACVYALAVAYRSARGVSGLGLGDVKLVGAATVWIDPGLAPWAMLAAASTALAGALLLALPTVALQAGRTGLPFAPFLAIGFWGCFVADAANLV